MEKTQHFKARIQQRCINEAMVDLILNLGSCNARGDMTLLGLKEIEEEIEKREMEIKELDKMRSRGGAGIIHEGNLLITAFHRNKRFKKNYERKKNKIQN